jgi:hypothetical protein
MRAGCWVVLKVAVCVRCWGQLCIAQCSKEYNEIGKSKECTFIVGS